MNELSKPDSTARGAGTQPTQQEELRRRRGKLRIFLGYAAGVGKTYAMLDAARQHQANGVDVVVAYVATHGCAETETLQHGLEFVSCRIVEQGGVVHSAMDLDAILSRAPELALVDELAHANPLGFRHPKRYQDVEEMLDAGINVYATLNIQHLASLKDVVAQITGVLEEETIPDGILERAEDIELVDLPIAELLHRLEEGRIYTANRAGSTASKFFRPGNLNALRELALRCVAERVDQQLQRYMQTQAIVGPWPVHERIMVCVSPSPVAERLIRAARRLATRLDAEWVAVYVVTPKHVSLSANERDQVAQTLRLAEELGAKAITTSAPSIVAGLIGYARTHNINKIVAGKPLRPLWRDLWQGSLVDQLIRRGKDIDVYVISSKERTAEAQPTNTPSRQEVPFTIGSGYLWGAAIVAFTTLVGMPVRTYVNPTNLVMFYLMGIVITALQWGRGPSIFASLLSVIAFDIIFVLPYHTIAVSDAEYLLTFAGLFIVGIVVSTLTARMAAQAMAAQEREEQAIAAFELSYDLATAVTLQEIAARTLLHTQRVFGGAVAIYLPSTVGLSWVDATTGYPNNTTDLEAATNLEAIEWAFHHHQPAGAGTDTLPNAQVRSLPLMTAHSAVGVLALLLPPDHLLPPQRRLLESFANQAALALERAQLAEAANELSLVQEREKFQAALLGSISHDLRTPLVTITGALSALQEQEALLSPKAQRALVATAHEQSTRLNQLVGNLLDMTRLEGGAIHVRRELCDLQDLVGAALERHAPALTQHQVELDVPDSLPLVPMDFVLMVQVLANLIDNAAKYSPPQTTIRIQAICREQTVEITVADEGTGIPPEELEQIFVKFHRVTQGDHVVGTGLGLSISKGLVEAHGGKIWASNRPGGGSILTVALPLEVTSSSGRESRP
jgi:two-component system sensor histidine kinase KdpD